MNKPILNLEIDEGMSACIPDISTDRQNFITLIKGLDCSVIERMEAAGIHKRLQIVIDNTERYFRREELFLQEWQYPKAEVHASSHKLVLKVLKKIQDSFKPCGLETEWQFAALKVKNILLSHILAEDMQCQIFQSNICERSSSKENMKWCHPH